MVSFIGAGSGSAHYFAPWAVGSPIPRRACLSEYVSRRIPANGDMAFT
jgi:hypothetical protein